MVVALYKRKLKMPYIVSSSKVNVVSHSKNLDAANLQAIKFINFHG